MDSFCIVEHTVKENYFNISTKKNHIDIQEKHIDIQEKHIDIQDMDILGDIKVVETLNADTIVSKVQLKVDRLGSFLPNSKTSTDKKIKITQKIIEETYSRLCVLLSGEKVSVVSIGIIVVYAMQLSNEILKYSKQYKIELAMCILRKLIEEEVKDPKERMTLHLMVESTVPLLLTTIEGTPSLLKKVFCCKGTD
jgi:hypothetical protein